MADLRPFLALRPPPALASQVASVPYDVVDTAEARELAAGNPLCFLHVVRPEIDLPDGTDIYADEVYDQGKRALTRLMAEGALAEDDAPALYVYQQQMGDHVQSGVVGCCPVDEYDKDLIKKHERTRPDKENDRTRHVLTLRAHAGPVFLTYRDDETIDRIVAGEMARPPLYDFVAVDGIAHRVWKVMDDEGLRRAFGRVPCSYVADGHHRSASASRARAACRDANPEHRGDEEYNFFLAVLFPGSQLKILPYNRVVHDLMGHSTEELLNRVRDVMDVSFGAPSPSTRGHFSMYVAGRWYNLVARAKDLEQVDPVACLDAAILQERVLAPILGIDDPRTSDRISFVGGIRGTQELVRRVDRKGGVAFALHPLGVDQLMAVADAGRVLPPKSTWFEPKLRSGLLVHRF